MIMISFKNKEDKEHLLEKAKKMEKYASMIVDCIEESEAYDDEDMDYRMEEDDEMDERMNGRMNNRSGRMSGRYGYRRRMR